MAALALADRCLDATGGDSHAALALAIRLTRLRMIARLELPLDRNEPLPLEVKHAREAAHRAA